MKNVVSAPHGAEAAPQAGDVSGAVVPEVGRNISDPMEKLIASGLDAAGLAFTHESQSRNTHGLDFWVHGTDVFIEVKQFHTPRIAEQMGRVSNVISIQGAAAVHLFTKLCERAAANKETK